MSKKEEVIKEMIREGRKEVDRKFPRVLIAIPTYEKKDYCLKELLEALDKLTYPNYDVIFCDTSPDNNYFEKLKKLKLNVIKSNFNGVDERLNLRDGRNNLRLYFLGKTRYDYFLSLEADNIPPKDVIQRLLKEQKEIVGGWYTLRSLIPSISLRGPYETNGRLLLPIFENLPGVFRVFMMGLGCVLIKRNIIEKLPFRVEKEYLDGNEVNWHDDVFFYEDCQKNNIQCYCIKSLKIPHIIGPGKTI